MINENEERMMFEHNVQIINQYKHFIWKKHITIKKGRMKNTGNS